MEQRKVSITIEGVSEMGGTSDVYAHELKNLLVSQQFLAKHPHPTVQVELTDIEGEDTDEQVAEPVESTPVKATRGRGRSR